MVVVTEIYGNMFTSRKLWNLFTQYSVGKSVNPMKAKLTINYIMLTPFIFEVSFKEVGYKYYIESFLIWRGCH